MCENDLSQGQFFKKLLWRTVLLSANLTALTVTEIKPMLGHMVDTFRSRVFFLQEDAIGTS